MKKNELFSGAGRWLGVRLSTRVEINTTRMIFRLMASEKMSNRSPKVVLGASNHNFKVERCQKIGTDFLSKYTLLHKMLTKYKFLFPQNSHSASTSLRSGLGGRHEELVDLEVLVVEFVGESNSSVELISTQITT